MQRESEAEKSITKYFTVISNIAKLILLKIFMITYLFTSFSVFQSQGNVVYPQLTDLHKTLRRPACLLS